MARHMDKLIPSKTYKTKANVLKAVSHIPDIDHNNNNVRFLIMTTDEGRFYPVFVGANLIHLIHDGFCVVA